MVGGGGCLGEGPRGPINDLNYLRGQVDEVDFVDVVDALGGGENPGEATPAMD